MPTRQHFPTFQNFQLWTLKPCGDTQCLPGPNASRSFAVAHNKQANAWIRPAGASASCAEPGGTRGQQPHQVARVPFDPRGQASQASQAHHRETHPWLAGKLPKEGLLSLPPACCPVADSAGSAPNSLCTVPCCGDSFLSRSPGRHRQPARHLAAAAAECRRMPQNATTPRSLLVLLALPCAMAEHWRSPGGGVLL